MDVLEQVSFKNAIYKVLSVVKENKEVTDEYNKIFKALENEKHKAFVPYTIKNLESVMHEQIENISECNKVSDIDFFLSEYKRMSKGMFRKINSLHHS